MQSRPIPPLLLNLIEQAQQPDFDMFGLVFLIRELIEIRQLSSIQSMMEKEEFKAALKKLNGQHFFLHQALKAGDVEGFKLLLAWMDGENSHPYDNYGESLLCVCPDDETCIALALKYTPDINHKIHYQGRSALQIAAAKDQITKARMLLQHGADPALCDELDFNFWSEIVFKRSMFLSIYRKCKRYGNVLSLPVPIPDSQGPNCGSYAVSYAAKYHYVCHASLFNKMPPPARKRDYPGAKDSVRSWLKTVDIASKGPIFSVAELLRLIDLTQCQSAVADITDYSQFMENIKNAVDRNLPTIIPFACGTAAPRKLQGESAHWAVVIGYYQAEGKDGVVLAQNGQFEEYNAKELFDAFYNIEPHLTEVHIYKKATSDKSEWSISFTPPSDTEIVDIRSFKNIDLQFFRRKLITVQPPACSAQVAAKPFSMQNT